VDLGLLIGARYENRCRVIGYLGFKNARFGKIDAHIATCAYAREAIQQASAIAESRGFKVIHGIVDSLWLKKEGASEKEYHDLCYEIETKLDLPISFEGIYKWIMFLNSRLSPKIPVLNRYYGVTRDGKMKVRGIDLRRHDTTDVVRDCQKEILTLLSFASNSNEFRELVPKAVDITRKYIRLIRTGQVPEEKLVLEKRLSKSLEEYSNLSQQAIAARKLHDVGRSVHAGQNIRYIVTSSEATIGDDRAVPCELFERTVGYDTSAYTNLLIRTFVNLFMPLGYDTTTAKETLLRSIP